jgi:hypothetical protein
MIKTYDYNLEKYNFVSLIQDLFKRENLQELHEDLEVQYDLFDKPGKDSDTQFHNVFYNRMRSGWLEFTDLYQDFIRDVIAPSLGVKDKLIYQRWPSFRVHLPDNCAVGGWHCDGDYNHPSGEINFILAITPMYESNTVIAESEPGKMDFRQLEIKPGQVTRFNGNECTHGNLPNRTGVTRVSFDFRIMIPNDYNASHRLTSLSKGSKFIIVEYYDIMDL